MEPIHPAGCCPTWKSGLSYLTWSLWPEYCREHSQVICWWLVCFFVSLRDKLSVCVLFVWLLLHAEVSEASAKLEAARRVPLDFITSPPGRSRSGCHHWPAQTHANRCVRDLQHPLCRLSLATRRPLHGAFSMNQDSQQQIGFWNVLSLQHKTDH